MAGPRSQIMRYVGVLLCALVVILISRSIARHVYVTSRDSRGWTGLHVAAYAGDLSAVEVLIHKGADVFATTRKEGYTPLHLAAMQGHTPVVRFLTSEPVLRRAFRRPVRTDSGHLRGKQQLGFFLVTPRDAAAAHLQDKLGRTPLHYAVINKHKAVCTALLSNRALILLRMDEIHDNDHRAPIAYAVLSGDMDMVRFLAEKGSRVDDNLVRDAVIHASPEMLELLFALGGSPSPRFLGAQLPLLHEAVIGERLGVMLVLLRHKVDVNALDSLGRSALRLAATYRTDEMGELLLSHGADPGIADHAGITPLSMALMFGRTKLVRMLVSRGVPPDLPSKSGMTLLHLAAISGDAYTAGALMSQGATVGTAMGDGTTPLHLAARYERVNVAELLLARGARVDARDDHGRTPLHIAAAYGADRVTKVLLAHGADPSRRDWDGKTAAQLADLYDQRAALGILLAHGAYVGETKHAPNTYTATAGHPYTGAVHGQQYMLPIDSPPSLEYSPLRDVVSSGDWHKVKAALDEQRELTQESIEKALLEAGSRHQAYIAELLVAGLADRKDSERRDDQFVPKLDDPLRMLMAAARAGSVGVADWWLARGASVRMVDDSGRTALHHAAEYGRDEMVRYLVERGADVDAFSRMCWTPLHESVVKGHASTGRLLVRLGATVGVTDRARHIALSADASDETALDVLRVSDARDESPNAYGQNGFHRLRSGDYNVARALVSLRANVNAVDRDTKETPLHHAAETCYDERIAELLVTHGAKLESRDAGGQTPLLKAVGSGNYGVVKVLLARGARVNVRDRYGTSLLDAARASEYRDVIRLLTSAER